MDACGQPLVLLNEQCAGQPYAFASLDKCSFAAPIESMAVCWGYSGPGGTVLTCGAHHQVAQLSAGALRMLATGQLESRRVKQHMYLTVWEPANAGRAQHQLSSMVVCDTMACSSLLCNTGQGVGAAWLAEVSAAAMQGCGILLCSSGGSIPEHSLKCLQAAAHSQCLVWILTIGPAHAAGL